MHKCWSFNLFLHVSHFFRYYYFFTLLGAYFETVDLNFSSSLRSLFAFSPLFPSYFASFFVSCSDANIVLSVLYSFSVPTYPANKKASVTILIYSRCTLLSRSRTSIFRVSSRRQFSREWWQTTTGCADAPEMSSRGKVPRCWKL